MDWLNFLTSALATLVSLAIAVIFIVLAWYGIYRGFLRRFQFVREFMDFDENDRRGREQQQQHDDNTARGAAPRRRPRRD